MFRILIIDDNAQRIAEIERKIQNEKFGSEIVVEHELEVSNAVRKLQRMQYDMLIIDIQLPSIGYEANIDVLGGVKLIDLIINTDRIIKPMQIIGITSYDEGFKEIEETLREKLCLLLKYEMGTVEWSNSIVEKVRYLVYAKNNMLSSFFHDNECDCLIITAVEREMNAVKECGLAWEQIKTYDNLNCYYRAVTPSGKKIIAVQQSQMGMVGAATTCGASISYFKPRLIAMVGIAAGNADRVNLGDVIVAESSWDYGSGKLVKKDEHYALSPDPHYITINSKIRSYFSNMGNELLGKIQKEWEKAHNSITEEKARLLVGALPSGAAVIQTEDLISEYIEPHNRKMLGLDMETYAIYYVADNSPCEPLFVSVKAVSDFANSQKNDDYQDYAAYLSVQILVRSLDELLPED